MPLLCHTNHLNSDNETGVILDSLAQVLIGVLNVASNIHKYGGVVYGPTEMRLYFSINFIRYRQRLH